MRKLLMGLLLLLLSVAGCNVGEPDAKTITIMTHDSFDVSEDVIAAFEEATNATVVVLPSGDAGAALNQAILAGDDPLADVFYGIDNSFLGRALDAGLFIPYESPLLAAIPDEFRLDSTNQLLPVDYGDVCVNYDRDYFADNGLPLPKSLADLTDPAYEGLLVVENPATSSPGLAFLVATVANFGESGSYTYLDYWEALRNNGLLVTNDWNEAYYGNFSVAGDGLRPLVVSYATSPPAEVIFADPPTEIAPSGALTAPGMCFRQVEFAGILKGTKNEPLARKLIDFLLDQQFQEDLPLRMFVFPVNPNATLPAVFEQWATVAADPATLSPATIDANRDRWIQEWTETVLR